MIDLTEERESEGEDQHSDQSVLSGSCEGFNVSRIYSLAITKGIETAIYNTEQKKHRLRS